MRYKPSRDIPKAIRETRSFSPTEIVNWIRQHRTEKVKGRRLQVSRTPESITMWINRHPKIIEQLQREVIVDEIPKEAISDAIFENGVFKEIPCVKEWIIQLRTRGAKEDVIQYQFVNRLRRMCQGIVRGYGKNLEIIEDWGLKHPKNLTIKDCQYYISEMQKRGYPTRSARLTARNFLKSKGIVIREDQISGRLEHDAGKYADLYVSKPKIHEILDWLKDMNEDAYLMSKFAYKTATRLSATLNAESSFVNREERTILVLEKASKGKKKRRISKEISTDLWNELLPRINNGGKLFNIEENDLNNLLRSAFEEVIPELNKRIPMPFHFWRHMFAQHMLRATNWNTSLVAKLGGWTTGALEKYYGKMSAEVAREYGRPHLNAL